ncbi:MAG: hypothetical protein J5988_09675, partial [Eubacterium sp.]|nr:hypothetical protein [Eubacterium sp.]
CLTGSSWYGYDRDFYGTYPEKKYLTKSNGEAQRLNSCSVTITSKAKSQRVAPLWDFALLVMELLLHFAYADYNICTGHFQV